MSCRAGVAGDTPKGAKRPAQASAGSGKTKSKVKKAPASPREEVNARQHLFAIIHGGGVPAGRAYEQAGFSAQGAKADVCASRLLRNVKVRELVESVRAKLLDQAEESAFLTLSEKRAFLARVVRTPVGKINQDSDLCQEWNRDEVDGGEDEPTILKIKVKMPCKMRALELDAKLAGELSEKGEQAPPPVKPADEEIKDGAAIIDRWGLSYAPKDVRGAEVG